MHTVWFLLFDRFQLLDVTGPLQVLATANEELRNAGREPFYKIDLCALQSGPMTSSSGVQLQAIALPQRMTRRLDTLIVPGGPGVWDPRKPASLADVGPLADWIRRTAPRIERIASVCTGAFVLARTGLLDKKGAATHWAACDSLGAAFPEVDVHHDPIYFRDGRYWTSAGVTAGIDMVLAMVEADLGREIAMAVAKKLVVFYRRPGGQSQFSSALLEQSVGNERIAALHRWIGEHLREPIDVDRMADHLSMTPRTFARFYVQATGVTPAKAVEKLRLEKACQLIESSQQSIKLIAQHCGFASDEVMRRSFIRHLRVAPLEYRQRFSVPRKVGA